MLAVLMVPLAVFGGAIGVTGTSGPGFLGYGTSLLNAVLANVHLDYPPSGLVCEFEVRVGDSGKGPG